MALKFQKRMTRSKKEQAGVRRRKRFEVEVERISQQQIRGFEELMWARNVSTVEVVVNDGDYL